MTDWDATHEDRPESAEEYYEWHYKSSVKSAYERIKEAEENPPEPCPCCMRRPYPIVATQHCWCEPNDPMEDEPDE